MQLTFAESDLERLAELIAAKITERLPAAKSDDTLLTEAEAAASCRVRTHTIRDARRRGVLQCSRAGRFPRYSREQLAAWLRGENAGKTGT